MTNMKKFRNIINESLYPENTTDYEDFYLQEGESPSEYVNRLKGYGEEAVREAMINSTPAINDLFPSAWSGWNDEFEGAPYPGFLAKILVTTPSAESITDIANIYYAGNIVSAEALNIFVEDAIENLSKWVEEEYSGLDFEDDPQMKTFRKRNPRLFQHIFKNGLSENELAQYGL